MENSVTSRNKALSSSNNEKTTEDSPEESSWTFYLQDFQCDHHDHDNTGSVSYNSCESCPSLVSDAFSSAARKAPDDIEAAVFASARSNCKNLSFKRRKAKASAVLNDHDLEDTASSPVNSPKANVCRKNSTAEAAGSAAHEEKNNQSELKKRGLCLAPVSTLTNYFG
ncbi:vascular-related unknown protein 4-like isoform X2 [Coffea eugenioides]|uniref:vascular-related unknown protein 4-like isoform X2 n=1 Tax=Coffea eugenioides TaxID=49369 RepID=UPI000F60CE4E|nr:vascular-related unknown protein 4-like isoform X2 [Coffea eugenioides]